VDALVDDLLEYSRIGRVHLEPEWVSAGPLLEHLIGVLGLREKAEVVVPADLPALWARKSRLEQILSNLLENAVKFRRADVRPVVTVEWVDREDAWELAVRDNGIGIESKHLDAIFGIFQRLQPNERQEGTGIGLPIVKKAVEEHGGSVWVESSPGKGSVFRFTLLKPEESSSGG
jgi:signal transduction histidine kinase